MPFDAAGLITATSLPLAGNTALQLFGSLIAAANGSDGSGAGGTDAGVGSPTVAEKPTDASKKPKSKWTLRLQRATGSAPL